MKCPILALALTTLALSACGSDDSDDGMTEAPGGFARLTFSVARGARESPNLQDALSGVVYGAIFAAEDVTITGPVDNAPEYGDLELAVDLTSREESEADWTTDRLAPGMYIFLGFLDVDANSTEGERDPDNGDPVTLPTDKFEVKDGVTNPVVIDFDMIL